VVRWRGVAASAMFWHEEAPNESSIPRFRHGGNHMQDVLELRRRMSFVVVERRTEMRVLVAATRGERAGEVRAKAKSVRACSRSPPHKWQANRWGVRRKQARR